MPFTPSVILYSMEMKFNTSGIDDLFHAMGELPNGMRNAALRPALIQGAQLVREKAAQNVVSVANAGHATGLLAKSVVVRSLRTKNKTLRIAVAVNPKAVSRYTTYRGAPARVGMYASVLEFGRVEGGGANGGNRNSQPPRPWLKPALKANANQVYSVVRQVAAQNLNKAIAESLK